MPPEFSVCTEEARDEPHQRILGPAELPDNSPDRIAVCWGHRHERVQQATMSAEADSPHTSANPLAPRKVGLHRWDRPNATEWGQR